MDRIEQILARHERIALQLSGGKDSIACLFFLADYLDRITVYTLDTGDMFPETRQVLDELRPMIPHYQVIQGNQPEVVAQHGLPSDIVPVSHTLGALFSDQPPAFLIQDRYSCCARTIMAPMHQRMIDDGITLIIRGQRNADAHKSTVRSGQTVDSFEFLFPIEDWSTAEVMAYLDAVGAPVPRFYESLAMAPDCLSCSAWWDEGRAAYLAKHHPAAAEVYQARLDLIQQATAGHITHFNGELIARSSA